MTPARKIYFGSGVTNYFFQRTSKGGPVTEDRIVPSFFVLFGIFFLIFFFFGLERILWISKGDSLLQTTHHLIVKVLQTVFVVGIIFMSFVELAKCLTKNWFCSAVAFTSLTFAPSAFRVAGGHTLKQFSSVQIEPVLEFFVVMFVFLVYLGVAEIVLFKSGLNTFGNVRVLSVVFFAWCSVLYCLNAGNVLLTLSLFLIPIIGDFCGWLFRETKGKWRIFKHSPNKSFEGIILASICSTIIASTLMFALTRNDEFKLWKIAIRPHLIPVLFLIISLFSSWGDLFFSKVKRGLKIKDYGTVLGGFGGFWDRFDSHAFSFLSAFLIYLIMVLF